MPTALVTGATGFVGSHVVRCLLERQQYTTVFILCRAGSKTSITRHAGQCVRRLEGDIESEADVLSALLACKPSYVFHLAGVYAWWQADHARFDRVNVNGVRNVVAACRAAGVKKLIHVSTVLAFGNPTGRGQTASTAFDEATPAGPAASAYAASKHAGDSIAQAAFDAGELDGCSLFLACCIGADSKLIDDQRDVMKIRPLVQGQIPATIASPTTFTYVYVHDALPISPNSIVPFAAVLTRSAGAIGLAPVILRAIHEATYPAPSATEAGTSHRGRGCPESSAMRS